MKVLELFSGTECISNAFRRKGHECFTVDFDEQFPSSLHIDIADLTAEMIIERFGYPDVIFLGTDCRSYSVAAISHHRKKNLETGNLDPISDFAKRSDEINIHCKELIKQLNPKIQIWENPRGGLRKMWFMQDLKCQTTTYCQYGFSYMKPTDFFSNIDLKLKPPCKNGDTCHEKAVRGSQSGIQRLKNPVLKAMYPPLLCDHIVDVCESIIEERICDCCGNKMTSGYVICDGFEYFCSDDCLHSTYSEEEYLELCEQDNAYWTEW